jgi:uncharacterized protein YjbI with pentapeptide repeats
MAPAPFDDSDSFENQTFSDLDIQGQDIADKEFYRCTFKNAKLGLTRWPSTRLEECVFDDCDLVGMAPSGVSYRGVEFRRSRLMGVDWTDVASNPDLTFIECNLRYVSFVGTNLRKLHFEKCLIIEGNFINAELIEAVFHDCDFTGTAFDKCDLSKADMFDARGLFVDPAKNRVKGLRVPVETAVMLALALGMKVEGYGEEKAKKRPARK